MKKFPFLFFLFFCMYASAPAASAAQIAAYVAEFAITGAPNKDELKGTLQTLLASRLNGENIRTVESATGADIVVQGSYIVIGKVFSIDAVVKDQKGKAITRAFQQGDSQDELIPAVGKLAQSLSAEIAKGYVPSAVKAVEPQPVAAAAPVAASAATPAATGAAAAAPAVTAKKEPVNVISTEIVKPEQVAKTAGSAWSSQRIDGTLIGIAPGRTLQNGVREIFVADKREIRLYRLEEELKLVAKASFKSNEKILGLDTADLDGDGNPEVYVTLMQDETLVSQVWIVNDGTLKKIADNLPYYMRGIALAGGVKKIYVQQMGMDQDYYGDVYELVKAGDKYEAQNPFKLPRLGYIYNFNKFADKGKSYTVVLSQDEYLVVYGEDGEEVWRSSDKYGGSELYFLRDDLKNIRGNESQYRWVFLEQRITVAKDGTVIVPQNGGFFVFGNNRAFKKNSVFAFGWNGASLDEKWHTKLSQNYLADYFYDEATKELVCLEVAKKEGMFSSGASIVTVKKVE